LFPLLVIKGIFDRQSIDTQPGPHMKNRISADLTQIRPIEIEAITTEQPLEMFHWIHLIRRVIDEREQYPTPGLL
jgi:hypothetical protein